MRNLKFVGSALLVSLCFKITGAPVKNQSDSDARTSIVNTRRVSLRHIESGGIGYHEGYTTFDAFFSLREPSQDIWLPFLDFRFHIFNNGKFAGNTGVGIRYLKDQRIWGANSYYDIRQGKKQVYNQLALGFESLGSIWDFRLNGYIPIGTKQSPFLSTNFEKFSGHSMILKRKYDFVMGGFNGEAGFHFNK